MAWLIEFDDRSKRQLSRLDPVVADRITTFLRVRLREHDDPRSLGEPLAGRRFDRLWRFRIGDYRVIARIEDERVRILVVAIGHRREVYR